MNVVHSIRTFTHPLAEAISHIKNEAAHLIPQNLTPTLPSFSAALRAVEPVSSRVNAFLSKAAGTLTVVGLGFGAMALGASALKSGAIRHPLFLGLLAAGGVIACALENPSSISTSDAGEDVTNPREPSRINSVCGQVGARISDAQQSRVQNTGINPNTSDAAIPSDQSVEAVQNRLIANYPGAPVLLQGIRDNAATYGPIVSIVNTAGSENRAGRVAVITQKGVVLIYSHTGNNSRLEPVNVSGTTISNVLNALLIQQQSHVSAAALATELATTTNGDAGLNFGAYQAQFANVQQYVTANSLFIAYRPNDSLDAGLSDGESPIALVNLGSETDDARIIQADVCPTLSAPVQVDASVSDVGDASDVSDVRVGD